ncbi:Phosphoglucosamine mutase [Halioglobus japonicus]|nr:Phosphoglucosamine mutase [Halioglobus japonicus]
MTKRYFGTDGIRGKVGEFPITPDFMLKLGWACGRVFTREFNREGGCLVIIGKDTRVSGYMFESALEAGLVAAGVNVKLLGPMPTPAVALMTRKQNAEAGIVISASHNPFYDNGIKFFGADGSKLSDAIEHAIEAEMELELTTVPSRQIGKVVRVEDATGRYIEFCKSTVPEGFSLRGLRIAVDCAHGATYHIAPGVLSELGAEVITMGADPDGFNINEGVGSTDMAALSNLVREHNADIGIAYDGDGDRVLMTDNKGEVLDGDELVYIIAMHRLATGHNDAGVVGTQMSNLGLEIALKKAGFKFERAQVGDRYVKAAMEANGWSLGGESSGHIICSDVTTTGDGIVASLQVLMALQAAQGDLAALRAGITMYPQTMINVAIGGKVDLTQYPALSTAVAAMEQRLGAEGRVLLRPSGTEPKVRVMVEGRCADQVPQLCAELATEVERILA